MSNQGVLTVLRELHGMVVDDDLAETMLRAVELVVATTSAAGVGAVLVNASGDLQVVASSSERAAEVEEAEVGIVQGPCLEAFRTGTVKDVPDLRPHADEWPDVVRIAEQRGFGGMYAAPLVLRSRTLGSLCVFFAGHDGPDDHDAAVIQLVSHTVAAVIAAQTRRESDPTPEELLEAALTVRDTIDQAKGAVSWRQGIGIDHAFRVIRDEAREAGLTVGQVAARIVGTQTDGGAVAG
ncbi:GAF and ANTAR domain-containing protein [Curtobacterium sp. ISL-83]|uniref:GAF and ANTAR domain-containing protein n=1 Tax=Curtobacterium sp. ISL-83 TaxID=2819145 RepID=UPI001BE71BAA|nr:GAF and ANTAR domain-containing protein [Curtobacterium sp. ISL-83]MBT2504028.1 GAF and ANTAR domain-containing protein [Curtobacterium sp. ISL-83]